MAVVITEKPSRVFNGVKLYDVEKLAKILETEANTIRRFFREEKFPKIKFNRRYYLSEQNLIKFLTTGNIDKGIENNLEGNVKKLESMKSMVVSILNDLIRVIEGR